MKREAIHTLETIHPAGKLSSWFYKIATDRVVLAAVVIFILFAFLVLPTQSSRTKVYSGETGSPDLSFYYSSAKLNYFAENFGENGRREYVKARFTFDLVFPLVYGSFLATTISWLFIKLLSEESNLRLVNLIPLCAVIVDYLENITTSVVMLRFPDPARLAGSLAGIFTALKWTLIGVSIAMLIVGTILILANLIRDSGSGLKKNH